MSTIDDDDDMDDDDMDDDEVRLAQHSARHIEEVIPCFVILLGQY